MTRPAPFFLVHVTTRCLERLHRGRSGLRLAQRTTEGFEMNELTNSKTSMATLVIRVCRTLDRLRLELEESDDDSDRFDLSTEMAILINLLTERATEDGEPKVRNALMAEVRVEQRAALN